jgi:hypothetical protein
MARSLKAVLASSGFLVVGLLLGLLGSSAYDWHYHPGDPDPVDFNTAAIFLSVWAAVWLLGTVSAIWWLYFKRLGSAA